jgi:hypothetical protein
MKVCTHCRLEVPSTANVCPGCLNNPGDGFEVWNFIISCLILGGLGWLLLGWLFG